MYQTATASGNPFQKQSKKHDIWGPGSVSRAFILGVDSDTDPGVNQGKQGDLFMSHMVRPTKRRLGKKCG